MNLQKGCGRWIGTVCITGCPKLQKDDYKNAVYRELGVPSVTSCSKCPYNEGCATCDLSGTGRCKEESK